MKDMYDEKMDKMRQGILYSDHHRSQHSFLRRSRRCYHRGAGDTSSFMICGLCTTLQEEQFVLAPPKKGYDDQITRSLRDRRGQGRR